MARDKEKQRSTGGGEKGNKNNFLPNRNSVVDVIFNPNGDSAAAAADSNHLIHHGGHGRQKNNR